MVGKNERILVTGAGGFAGGAVACYLKRMGWEVVGTVHIHTAEGAFDTVYADLSLPWKISGQYDVIIHTAGVLPYRQPTMLDYKRSNIDVMQHLVEYAQRTGVKRVIYFSSIGVYGDFHGNTTVDEDTDIINPDAYGLTKYTAECLLRESGLENISLRMPGIIGPGARPIWFTNTIEKFRRNEPVQIYAPDFQTNNFVWIEDVAAFIAHLLQQSNWRFDKYVLACSESASIREIVSEMQRIASSSSKILIGTSDRLPFCLNPVRALASGYKPHAPLEIIRAYMNERIND